MASINVSHGTCYSDQGVEADAAFIPCGNDAFGHVTCCGRGDWCLMSNACYNQEFGITYLQGCSDPDYQDPSCPDKSVFPGYPWLGLVYCNGTSRQWAACPQKKKPEALTSPDFCYCPATERPIAFTADSVIQARASLPTATGETIAWVAGFAPIAPTTATTSLPTTHTPSSTSTRPLSTTSSAGTEATASGSTPSPSGLSSGASIGIGVGIGLGGVLALIALAILLARLRRKKRNKLAAAELNDNEPKQPKAELSAGHGQSDNGNGSGSPAPWGVQPGSPSTMSPSELDPASPRPWSMSSELEGRRVGTFAEVTQEGGSGSPAQGVSPSSRSGERTFVPYRPVLELPG
ncbi:hypothetical protein B0T14DRAFT_570590 [Immersiella caudata]|uniref:Uncharacterized protein n=1 Tax=Immersiella caudata TaxID=314043 RepID=A0AA39WFZ3_9PEZI|nr:hypothetical protein B0T14DRAFT_570590 [Immersiella caudata]